MDKAPKADVTFDAKASTLLVDLSGYQDTTEVIKNVDITLYKDEEGNLIGIEIPLGLGGPDIRFKID